MRLARGRERQPQRLLGAGLADRAGDADHLGLLNARARRGRDRAGRRARRGTTSSGASLGNASRLSAATTARPAPLASAAATNSWPSRASPLIAKNASPRPMVRLSMEMPETDAGSAPRALGAHRLRHRIEGPERSTAHAGFPCSAAATASWSLNGSVWLPTIWPVSWPLPAISSTSPLRSSAMLRAIASPRSPISMAPGADLQDGGADLGRLLAARIVVGHDHAVGLLGRDRAHHRALAGIAVAAAAEHDDELPRRIGPQRLQRLGERVGLVGVVDEDRRAVALAGEVEPALGALEPFERGEHRARLAAGGDREPGGGERVLDLEAADQRQPHACSRCRHRSSFSTCAKPSMALSLRRMPSPAPADGQQPQPALLRRRDRLRRHARDRRRSRRRRAAAPDR